jgi:hypothetical protein
MKKVLSIAISSLLVGNFAYADTPNEDLSDGTVFLKETFLPNSEHMIFDDCHHFELISSKYAINKIKDFI